MARRVFYSFRYKQDNWRVQQVKQMGAVEGQPLLSSNQWETVKGGGDSAVKKWIDDQMYGKSCLVVLIGNATAGRKWIKYEINKAWQDGPVYRQQIRPVIVQGAEAMDRIFGPSARSEA
jgi:hypothetical protein